MTDPTNNKTTWTYDAFGRVELETNQLGKAAKYDYDALGNVKLVTNRDGTKIESGFDSLGRKVSEKWRSSNDTVVASYFFTYNVSGELLTTGDSSVRNIFTYTPR